MVDELDILFEDDYVLLVNKPGGVATQAPRQFDSLEARVRNYLAQRARAGQEPYLGIPHRLDRCASGAIVFAKRIKAAQRLSRQFQRREVTKTYLALADHPPQPVSGIWRDYMRKVPCEPRAELVPSTAPDAKLAVLRYVSEPHTAEVWRIWIGLETGRMHQIRLQLATRGCPILGDMLYGSRQSFGPRAEHPRERWIGLHAAKLCFVHPRTRDPVHCEAPLPACWPRDAAQA